jgi:hypothetical protein
VESINSNNASSDDSMAECSPASAHPRHSVVKNTGHTCYKHFHGRLVLFLRVEDSESGHDACIKQVVHGLSRPEFKEFKAFFPGWLSLHANNTDGKLAGKREPHFARGIVLFKGLIKKEAAQTTARSFKTSTTFLNDWTHAGRRLNCVKDEGGHWCHCLPSQGAVDRAPKDKRKLGDLICVHDSLSIVKSIATETLGCSSKCCQQDKKFTTMCLNPQCAPVMMTALQMETPSSLGFMGSNTWL